MRWSCKGLRSRWHVVGPPSAQLHVLSSCCRFQMRIEVSPKRYRVQGFKVKVKAFPPGKSFPWSSWSGWPRWDRLRGCRGAREAQWWWEISSCCISSHPHFPPRSPQTCLFDELGEKTPPSYLFLLITKDVTWKYFTGSWWWKLRESGHLIVKPHKTTLGAVHYLAGSHNTMTQRVKTCFQTNNRGHFFICMIYAWLVK